MTMVRLQRTAAELHDEIVAEVQRQPGHEGFDAAFTIALVREWEPGSYRTWDAVGAFAERDLSVVREAVDRLRRRFDLWPWPEPSAPAQGTTPSF